MQNKLIRWSTECVTGCWIFFCSSTNFKRYPVGLGRFLFYFALFSVSGHQRNVSPFSSKGKSTYTFEKNIFYPASPMNIFRMKLQKTLIYSKLYFGSQTFWSDVAVIDHCLVRETGQWRVKGQFLMFEATRSIRRRDRWVFFGYCVDASRLLVRVPGAINLTTSWTKVLHSHLW